MNTFLQNNLFTIILFLLFIILLLIAIIGAVLLKLLMNSKKDNPPTNANVEKLHSVLIPTIEAPEKIKKLSEEEVVEKYYCENHPDVPSVGSCLICEDVFCDQCLIEHDSLYFCKEHFKTFANNKWKQITDVKTTPNTPEDGLYIYHFKRHIWHDKKTPSFVLTHYKINIEEDYIESFIQLNVIEDKAEELLGDIEKFMAKP
jgi:hypothetical protein